MYISRKKLIDYIFFNPFPNMPWFLCVCCTSLLKTLGKGEIARNEQFLLSPWCFLPIWRTFYCFHQFQNCPLLTLSVWKSLNLLFGKGLMPFKHYFGYIMGASAPSLALLEFILPVLHTIFLPSHWRHWRHWLISHITFIKTMGSDIK